jgi:hypothetical protein
MGAMQQRPTKSEGTHDARDEAAARNNADWCAAVWRSHGLPVEQTLGLWVCARETPQFYPNAITVDLAADPRLQERFVAEFLSAYPSLNVSLKDSFASLDLRPFGMAPLFDARWLVRPAQVESADGLTLQWRRIDNQAQLSAWEAAWRGADKRGARIFRQSLLSDPCAIVLGGFGAGETILAGGIAYDAAGALGITNVFGSRWQFIRALGAMHPGRSMVCYETGDAVRSTMQLGFQALGSLRVWTRGT